MLPTISNPHFDGDLQRTPSLKTRLNNSEEARRRERDKTSKKIEQLDKGITAMQSQPPPGTPRELFLSHY